MLSDWSKLKRNLEFVVESGEYQNAKKECEIANSSNALLIT